MNGSEIRKKITERRTVYYHVNDTQFADMIPIDVGYSSTTKWEVSDEYPYFLLHYLISGKAYLEMDDKKYAIKKGQMFLVHPNHKVKYYNAEGSPVSFLWLNFNGLNCQHAIDLTAFNRSFVINVKHKKEILNAFFGCLNDCNEPVLQSFSSFSALHYIFSLLVSDNLENIKNSGKTNPSDFRSILNTINKYLFNNRLTEKFVCQQHFITQEHLSRMFVKNMDMHFSSYVNLERIKKACSMLEKNDLKIATIASLVGFSDVFYFCKVFKKYRLLTPSQYREKHQKENNQSCLQ